MSYVSRILKKFFGIFIFAAHSFVLSKLRYTDKVVCTSSTSLVANLSAKKLLQMLGIANNNATTQTQAQTRNS